MSGEREVIDGTLIVGAPRGFTGQHPSFIVYNGGRIERARPTSARKLYEGVWVFDCPYEDIDPAEFERFVCKREFQEVANEIKFGSGNAGAGGTVFKKLVELLAIADSGHSPEWKSAIWGAMRHTNKDQVTVLELDYIDKALKGEFDHLRAATQLFTGYGRRITEAVFYGINRHAYLDNAVVPTSHQSALELGYAVLECAPEALVAALSDPGSERTVRIGDLLAHLGVDVPMFKPRGIDDYDEL